MKLGAQIALRAASRFYVPLLVLFALTLLIARAPGEGVGFVAGLALTLALLVHVLVFGAVAGRAALPPPLARLALAGGVLAAIAGAAAPRLVFAPQLAEGGAFVATVAGGALILAVLVGRAPTMRDEEL